jgi:hypothetical protein
MNNSMEEITPVTLLFIQCNLWGFFYICWKDIPRFFCKALNTGKYQLVFKVISQLYLIVLKYVILGERVRLQY